MRSPGKHDFLAFLRRVSFDDPNTAQRFSESSRHFSVNLTAFTKQRSELFESQRHGAAKGREGNDDDGGQPPVEIEKDGKRDRGGHQPAHELYQSRAHKITYAFGVGHDARDEDACLRGIKVSDGQASDMLLHTLAHFGDGSLSSDP